jgi:hypothetical protein
LNRRAVWQLQGRDGEERQFLYFSGDTLTTGVREEMAIGSNDALLFKCSSDLLPDRQVESGIWYKNKMRHIGSFDTKAEPALACDKDARRQ